MGDMAIGINGVNGKELHHSEAIAMTILAAAAKLKTMFSLSMITET